MPAISLKEISTRAPKEFEKIETKEKFEKMLVEMDELQNLLFASATYSLLVVIQGMDASGKDGAIRNVFSSSNPQGVSVTSFKVPTEEELAHDFLWRIHRNSPRKGMIHIFNRSHYEDVLVTRVHKWCDDETANRRMKAINQFEDLLTVHNNTRILKFYLHVSADEQMKRLKERMDDPAKMWKYNEKDFSEAALFNDYQKVYEDCFEKCNNIPWIIVPADQNWYKEYVMLKAILETLRSLDMEYPGLKKS
ncbi:MAG TPA: PPK2 family polyphosphate kinase [Flavitalea sp.]|nr:PPK2 family polyphosphate kinase [Flavitalea sp.]